jgi:cytoskeletal protein CcmA (bactofilin family)
MALFQKDSNPIPSKPASRTPAPSLLGMPASDHAKAMQSSNPKDTDPAAKPEHKASESRLIVGPNIKLKGVEIEDCDTLVVEGYVEASMDSRVIEIAESGVYKGKVEIDTAIVRGRFEGELTARERLVVHATGDVQGTIRYGRLAIEEGGRVHGDLDETSKPHRSSDSQPKKQDGAQISDAAE